MELQLKLITIIQARQGSMRFPGKVLKKYKDKTFLEILIRRLQKSKVVNKIIVATSNNPLDHKIKKICRKLNIYCYRGSELDVIDRYYKVAKLFKAQNIIRITADCPLIDSNVVDQVTKKFFTQNADYASNIMPATFPDGLDIEIFKFNSLYLAWKASRKISRFKEHVTTHIRENKKLKKINYKYQKDYSFIRLTLDDTVDLKVICNVLNSFSDIYNFDVENIIQLYKKDKSLFNENIKARTVSQNMNLGQKYWKRAKNIIPGGTMLFSKNPDLFLPDKWPAYFSKTKGCRIWDMENTAYDDLSSMGVGTNILGYNYPSVERKVIENVKKGTMSSLNSVEEILLAEKLISLHPWAEMVRFTRSGGEANAVAIRISRAATGKDKVAICGYHGWHDWYLSNNIQDKDNLNKHLMKDTPIKGVPKNLKNTVFSFEYNNFEELKKIISQHDIGTIKMEVKRNTEPKNNFLQKIRKLANDKNIVLIFDECTSGFRQTFGGLHKYYGVNPDMAIFGKALGNGYAINSIIGKRSIMEACNSSFISSTFWTERIGPTAALETLSSMEKIKSWELISNIGRKIKKNWTKLSKLHNLQIDVEGIDAIPNFSFRSKNNLFYKTFISQEMLKKKILASNYIFCSVAHREKNLNKYYDCLERIFYQIKQFENEEKNVERILEGRVCISGMRNK
jgi:glutamate-1-semialdehyde 2,1-aminomutase